MQQSDAIVISTAALHRRPAWVRVVVWPRQSESVHKSLPPGGLKCCHSFMYSANASHSNLLLVF